MKPHHLLHDGQGLTANALWKKLLNGAVGADCFKNIVTEQQAKSPYLSIILCPFPDSWAVLRV